MEKDLAKLLKSLGIDSISEGTIRLVVGVLTVLAVGVLAYNVFKGQNQTPASSNETKESLTGTLGESKTAVALPAQHTVESGETLWSIAEKYYQSGYNWIDIAKANNLTGSSVISAGGKLTIPKTEVIKPVVSASTPVVTDAKIASEKYTIIRGDTLWSIAVRAYGDGYQWPKIATANKLANPNLIHADNILVIPR
jgi:nucleoid-associated protein YgaU